MGPKRLWTGDWSAQSAASRARMAERRGLIGDLPEVESDPQPAPVPRRSAADLARAVLAALAAALAAFGAGVRSLVAEARGADPARRGTRIRLTVIALIAAVAGAGAMVGIEASDNSSPTTAATRQADRAWLGIALGSALGQAGAMVESVQPGGPAEEGGIQPGDVITAIDGHGVSGPGAAASVIGAARPGDTAVLAIERFGQPITLRVTLGSSVPGAP
jgi:membrane-associated protease RseP (regulator of RpoE activity)